MILIRIPFYWGRTDVLSTLLYKAGQGTSSHTLRMSLLYAVIISEKTCRDNNRTPGGNRTMPFLSSEQLQLLISRHRMCCVSLESQNSKMHSDSLVPHPFPQKCLSLWENLSCIFSVHSDRLLLTQVSRHHFLSLAQP